MFDPQVHLKIAEQRLGYCPETNHPWTLNEFCLARLLACHTDLVLQEALARGADKLTCKFYPPAGPVKVPALHAIYPDIDWKMLHYPVVMKPSHGSGLYQVIHELPGPFEQAELAARAALWLRTAAQKDAPFKPYYERIPPRVFVEEYVTDPTDYKIFVCSGRAVMIQVIAGRGAGPLKVSHCTSQGEWLDMDYHIPNSQRVQARDLSAEVREMLLYVAEEVVASVGGPARDFVRVDLYYSGGEVFFGELDWAPGHYGVRKIEPYDVDRWLGSYIKPLF